MRAIIPAAATGNSAASPKSVCPLVTVRRLVPSRSISASRPAWEEEERPRTATIAATPIAIPSADSAARMRRVRRPTLATRARSPGWSRFGASEAVALIGSAGGLVDERERGRVTGCGRAHDPATRKLVRDERGSERDALRVGRHPDRTALAREEASWTPGRRRKCHGDAGDGVLVRVGDRDREPDREAP